MSFNVRYTTNKSTNAASAHIVPSSSSHWRTVHYCSDTLKPLTYESISNFTFHPQSTSASEVFGRSDTMDLKSLSVFQSASQKQPLERLVPKSFVTVLPDEVDRSTGSSTLLEHETMLDNADSYVKDAEIRLNLFMNSSTKDETTV
ncbi:hypothetical protein RB195_003756 [Necator americanus]|uniref:Uncharacterized protein n=1 Tax=Necator americanus TaxID=51031 RepID=A0ABR1DQ94_NECAM